MKRIFILAAFLTLVNAAYADGESGFYLGVGLGQFDVQIDDVDDIGPIVDQFDGDDDSFKIFGGWRFVQFLAVELDYIDFGGPNATVNGFNVEADLDGFAPFVVGTLPLGPFELSAKAGYLFYDLDTTIRNVQNSSSSSESDSDAVYGVGAGITFFERLNLKLEYELIEISDVDDADALWLSVAWRF